MRAAVVGHVEWVHFLRVDRPPASGEIAHAIESWEAPAGGGPVAAAQLLKLAGAATFLTALGDDDLGHRALGALQALGLRVHAVFREAAQRRAVTFLDERGERTITVIGERLHPRGSDPLPWHELEEADAVYFTAGDEGALRHARRARVVVATSRLLPLLSSAGIPLDAVVGSADDPAERYPSEGIRPAPRLAVRTAGATGGTYSAEGGPWRHYPPVPPPGPVVDGYGCGDSFAAGLAYGLAAGFGLEEALSLAARCGAACLTGAGPYEGQLRLTAET